MPTSRRSPSGSPGCGAEAHRVLAPDGVLAFTYHHSRSEGWRSVLHALMKAGFSITAVHPIKAEMSVAMPKLQAREPIDLDIILVCRKRTRLKVAFWDVSHWEAIRSKAAAQAQRLRDRGRGLSRNDVRIIVMAQLILKLSLLCSTEAALAVLDANDAEIEASIGNLHGTGDRVRRQVLT